MTNFLLLTGAGYTKNWGGWLAKELWSVILSHPFVQENQGLKNIVWEYRDKGFEAIFDDKRIWENQKYFNDFHVVIKDSFARMHRITLANLEEFNRWANNFVYEFDAFFTLNQDIFFEALHHPIGDSSLRYFYPHIKSRAYYYEYNRFQDLRIDYLQNLNHFFDRSSLDATLAPNPRSYLQKYDPSLQKFYPLATTSATTQIKKRKPLPYYKLHGSLSFILTTGKNWEDDEGREWVETRDVMVMGGSKSDQIKNFPLLLRYHEDFEKALNKAKRLMIVGYSFSDPHINKKIFDAVENHGLKFWIIDVAHLSRLIANAALAAQPDEMLTDKIKKMMRPLRPGGRGYSEKEILEEVLIPQYEEKFKKSLISISNNSLHEIFYSRREVDRIAERFFN